MLPLILEPEKWERPALLELAESLNGALEGILGAFESGYAATLNPELVAREPERRDAAVELLRIVVDLYKTEGVPSNSDLAFVEFVNLQYQTMRTVMVLVPGPPIPESRRRAKAWRDATAARAPPPSP
jgi:hypothetical protein